MSSLIQDLRLGVRLLGRRPATAALAVVALALGIGLTTTMFGVVNGVFLRGLPFERADRLVYIGMIDTTRPGRPNQMTGADVSDLLAQQQSLEGLGTFALVMADVADLTGGPFRYDGYRLDPNVLRLLRVRPALGRPFGDDDSAPGAAPVVLISHKVWTVQFQADPAIVGKVVRVNQEPATIVGVMAPKFGFPDSADIWLPLTATPAVPRAGAPRVSVFGRLRDGVSIRQANEEFGVIGSRLASQYVENKEHRSPRFP